MVESRQDKGSQDYSRIAERLCGTDKQRIAMDAQEEMEKLAKAIETACDGIATRAEYLLVADYTDKLSKTVINKWDGAKLISSIEL